VLSETCEFYGRSGHVDTALSDGVPLGGGKASGGRIKNHYPKALRNLK